MATVNCYWWGEKDVVNCPIPRDWTQTTSAFVVSPRPCAGRRAGRFSLAKPATKSSREWMPMRRGLLDQVLILLACGAIFLWNLGAAGLWDEDEALYGECAREMVERGDWVVPTFNGQLFAVKPPLMYWTMIAASNSSATTNSRPGSGRRSWAPPPRWLPTIWAGGCFRPGSGFGAESSSPRPLDSRFRPGRPP